MAAHAAHQRPRVIQGPGENAGVVDIGDGQAVVFKMESAQPSELHRALPGRGDRCRRHPARRLHDGRAPRRGDERAALRAPKHEKTRHRGRRRGRRRRLRQFLRRATVGGEVEFDALQANLSTPLPPACRSPTRFLLKAEGVGAGRLSRRQDGATAPRGDDGSAEFGDDIDEAPRPCRSATRSPAAARGLPELMATGGHRHPETWVRPASPARRWRWAPRATSASSSTSTPCRCAKPT